MDKGTIQAIIICVLLIVIAGLGNQYIDGIY